MIVKINLIEAACELAHQKLVEKTEIQDERDLYEDTDEKSLNYKEAVQDIFNEYYDEYFEKLSNLALNL